MALPLLELGNLLNEKPESFASGSTDIQVAAISAAKYVFDLSLQSEAKSIQHITSLLSTLSPSHAPQTRSQAKENAKRKRSPSPSQFELFKATPLTSLFTDAMDEDQIWAQLDLRASTVCDLLDYALEGEMIGENSEEPGEDEGDEDEDEEDAKLAKALEDLENGREEEDDDDLDAFLDESDSEGDDDSDESAGEEEDLGEDVAQLRDPSDEELEPAIVPAAARAKHERKSKGHPGLDDGFFNLAAFNAEIDATEARTVSKGGLKEDSDSDDDMSVDYFAPVDAPANFDEEDLENDAEPFYQDFFEPPPRVHAATSNVKHKQSSPKKAAKKSVQFHEEVRVKKIKPNGRNRPLSAPDPNEDGDDDDEDFRSMFAGDDFGEFDEEMEGDLDEEESGDDEEGSELDDPETGREAIERLKDDLFDEGESEDEADMTTHEKRLAAIKEQISSLEAENVGTKDWVLMGEAGSRSRPQNSLLEEDLEFERVMKAVPVVTEESVLVLEERIKARILEGRFDDVVRLKPMDDKPFLPSRFFELKDTKSTASLAQIYEDEYTAGKAGAGEDRDGKLSKEHDEIEHLWEGISAKLDALCNAHYMPKQPKATISTVANVSTTSLESALPTSKSAADMLAPEEVFAPVAGDLRARSELTPTEKRSLRTKERKAKKHMRDALDKSVDKYAKKARGIGGVKKQKQAALESVVKTGRGVTVIGKKPETVGSKKRAHLKSSA